MEDLVRAIALPALLLACACQEEKSPIQPGTYFPVAIALGPALGGTYDHPSPCATCLQGPCAFVFRFGARAGIEAMEGFRTCAAQGPPFASCWTALAGEPNDPVSPDDPIFEPSEWFDPKAASCCADGAGRDRSRDEERTCDEGDGKSETISHRDLLGRLKVLIFPAGISLAQ